MHLVPAFFFLNALIWTTLGLATYLRSTFSLAWLLTLLMFANAAAMATAGWGVKNKDRGAYFFGLALLAVNILLTVTDQFGLIDGITLAIDLILIGLLIAYSGRYLPTPKAKGENPS